jgi:hypothetical protein
VLTRVADVAAFKQEKTNTQKIVLLHKKETIHK